jgi:hypothetical protein
MLAIIRDGDSGILLAPDDIGHGIGQNLIEAIQFAALPQPRRVGLAQRVGAQQAANVAHLNPIVAVQLGVPDSPLAVPATPAHTAVPWTYAHG